jgi:hypothetical protein
MKTRIADMHISFVLECFADLILKRRTAASTCHVFIESLESRDYVVLFAHFAF